jgi:hypothetical protein
MANSLSDSVRAASMARSAPRMAGIAIVLAFVGLAFAPVAGAAATPTLTVKPNVPLVGNQTLNITGKDWSSSSSVQVDLCGGTPQSQSGCLDLTPQQPSKRGTWRLAYEPLVGASPAVCQMACFFEASQGTSVVDAAVTVLSPSLSYVARRGECCYIGQPISFKGAGFPAGDTIHINTCSSSEGCSADGASQDVASGRGSVRFTGFAVDWSVCDDGCYVLATDPSYGNGDISASLDLPVYCGPIACPPSLPDSESRR